MKFCQSCGMPLTDEILGTNADGSKNEDYCMYCYKDGKFLQDCTMDEMIDFCAQFVDEVNKSMLKLQPMMLARKGSTLSSVCRMLNTPFRSAITKAPPTRRYGYVYGPGGELGRMEWKYRRETMPGTIFWP